MRHQIELKVAEGKPVLRGSAHFWAVIRELDATGPWAVPDIEARSNDARATILGYVLRLVRGGYAKVTGARSVGIRGHSAKTYRLLKRPVDAPRLLKDGSVSLRGNGTVQIWNAMRQLKVFSTKELSVAASTEECRVGTRTASAYIQHLRRAGYLTVDRRTKTFRLKPSMNTGPRAPMILATRVVFDQNLKHPVGSVVAEEVRP